MLKEKVVLQDILFDHYPKRDGVNEMHYRSSCEIVQAETLHMNKLDKEQCMLLASDSFFDFSTYFNSLSIGKWKKYTYAEDFALRIVAKGKFEIKLMGHFVNEFKQIKKEWLGSFLFDSKEKQTVVYPFPVGAYSDVVSFQIETSEDTYIYNAEYIGSISEDCRKQPKIALVTTTFKKEAFIDRNYRILKKELFDNHTYREAFKWYIIDNGQTLESDMFKSSNIKLVKNSNVGGAGGFTRGMIEALKSEYHPTHILLMDDDVLFIPDSFKRVYMLLSLLKDQYVDYFISGAMLEINEQNIQHEDVGRMNLAGEHGPTKPRFDLNRWDSVILNETMEPTDEHLYAGWWYCCIPTTIAREDNLPLPFFIRGDDVEYSLRNHAKFITMNGICIWHQGFGNKFSAAMELYQVHRNDLILQAIHSELNDIDVMKRMKDLFWQEIYKYNYKGADLLLDAIEDYLKGPEFLKSLNGEKCMMEKKKKDNVLLPVTEDVRKYINYEKLYQQKSLGKVAKFIYDYTCNGQKRIRIGNHGVGVIPYGWGYYQQKQNFKKTIYAIDPANDLYVLYKKDLARFDELSSRYNQIMEAYEGQHEQVDEAYRNAEKEMESKEFWMTYLA